MPDSQEHPDLGRLLCKKGRQGGLIGVGIMLIGFALLIGHALVPLGSGR
jgi:hypothetical protein